MYAVGEGSGWVSEDYQFGKFEDGSVLSEEEFQESLRWGEEVFVKRDTKGRSAVATDLAKLLAAGGIWHMGSFILRGSRSGYASVWQPCSGGKQKHSNMAWHVFKLERAIGTTSSHLERGSGVALSLCTLSRPIAGRGSHPRADRIGSR